jgi:malate dehydrogenase
MEIEDTASPLVHGVVATTDLQEAFTNINYAILVGAMPRKEGMERKDLLKANCGIFKVQGKALNDYANKDVKVLVVGNPANTNALIAALSAPGLPKENFSCLTRLDHNRAKSQIAKRLHVSVDKVHNVAIWGNHSKTQYPDINHAYVSTTGDKVQVRAAVADDAWLQGEFITTVQNRGAAIIAARKLSSAASAAQAIVDHMRDWVKGTPEGEFVSMGVWSDGSYGVAKDLIYSFPVTCKDGKYTIVQGLEVDAFSREKLQLTEKELLEEKGEASEFLH